jgi:uncharacterized protein
MAHRDPLPGGREGRAIAIMAKAPRNGHVKTRLAPSLPPDRIVRLYTCLLTDTLALARSLDGIRVALVCPAGDAEALGVLAGDHVAVVRQQGRGLAAGLDSAFRLLLGPDCRQVVALDSDSPHLPPAVLTAAFAHLETHDLVVGPTRDGGYYLVGASAAHPGLFDAAGMGTTTALNALLTRARSAGLAVARTPEGYDVDEADDLARLAADLRADPSRAPATAALLRELGF